MSYPMLPTNDDEFDTATDQYCDAVIPDPTPYGLTTADVTALTTTRAAWKISHPANVKAQADAITATTKKNLDKDAFGTVVRGAMKKSKNTHGITDDLLVAAGIAGSPSQSAAVELTTRPLGRTDLKPNNTVVVHFVDEATPLRTAKPPNAHGCEIWSFVGSAPPASPSGYTFLAVDTRTPYTDNHPAADAGKNVYYLLRWQNHKGQSGPWSDVVSAKIPG